MAFYDLQKSVRDKDEYLCPGGLISILQVQVSRCTVYRCTVEQIKTPEVQVSRWTHKNCLRSAMMPCLRSV